MHRTIIVGWQGQLMGAASSPVLFVQPAMSMSKVRVLRREDSTGQVSPSGNTSISDGPRPTPEAVGAQPAAAMSSPRSSLDDSAKIKQSSPTGNGNNYVCTCLIVLE